MHISLSLQKLSKSFNAWDNYSYPVTVHIEIVVQFWYYTVKIKFTVKKRCTAWPLKSWSSLTRNLIISYEVGTEKILFHLYIESVPLPSCIFSCYLCILLYSDFPLPYRNIIRAYYFSSTLHLEAKVVPTVTLTLVWLVRLCGTLCPTVKPLLFVYWNSLFRNLWELGKLLHEKTVWNYLEVMQQSR